MSRLIKNETPFSALVFKQLNPEGIEGLVLAVRGTFDIIGDWLWPSPSQEPIQLFDRYRGEPASSELVSPSDYFPHKPATDITVVGAAHAPDRRPAASWLCGLRVESAAGDVVAEKLLRAHGPRLWRAARANRSAPVAWRLEEAEPALSTPLLWSEAFGGVLAVENGGPRHDPANPLGPGLPGEPREGTSHPAPRLEAAEDPIRRADALYTPANLAPVAPAWRPRSGFVGTFDQRWRTERDPRLPEDFDYRFYNCAAPGLAVAPHLTGTETIRLLNLTQGGGVRSFRLPGLRLEAFELPENLFLLLRLDGVHIDVGLVRPRVCLTWRAGFFGLPGADTMTLYDAAAREEEARAAREAAARAPLFGPDFWEAP